VPHPDSGRPPAWVRLTGTVSTCWEPAGGAMIHAGSMQNSALSLELVHGIACRGRVSRRRHVLDVGLTTRLGEAGVASHFLGTGIVIRSTVALDAVPGQSPVG